MKKIIFFLGLLCIALPSFFLIQADPDLWGHTQFGIDHIQNQHIASSDPYSFMTEGRAWVNHEWLTEFLFAKLYLANKGSGLFMLRGFVFAAMLVLFSILLLLHGRHELVTLVFLVFSVPVLGVLVNVRPHMFTALFTVFYLLTIQLYRRGQSWIIWSWPIVMAVWVNLHGGFVVGCMLLTLFWGLCFLKLETERQHVLKKMSFALLLTFVATLINPYGIGLHVYLLEALRLKREYITEWQNLPQSAWYVYVLFCFIPLLLSVFKRKKIPLTESIVFVFTSVYAFFNSRLVVFLVLLSGIIFVRAMGGLFEGTSDIRSRLSSVSTLLIVVIAVGMTGVSRGWNIAQQTGANIRVNSNRYPVESLRVLKNNQWGKKMAVSFNWGEYAIWHLFPDYLVSVDGRYETVYDPSYVEKILKASAEGNAKEYLANVSPDVIWIESDRPLSLALENDLAWKLIYKDDVASIFLPAEYQPMPDSNQWTSERSNALAVFP